MKDGKIFPDRYKDTREQQLPKRREGKHEKEQK